jgi:DNA-binding transcriptional LysR family regulator
MNLQRLDLASLALFRAVCLSGSITGGALDYGLVLGAASRRIANLERQLGTPLLRRSKKGVTPTPAGASLLEHVHRLLAEADRIEVTMADFRMGIDRRVRVWANTSAVNGFLPDRLAAFARIHPDVRVELEEAFSEAIARAVLDGRIDIGIFAESEPAPGLHTVVCDTHRLVALLPPRHPAARRSSVSFEDLLQYDFVGLTRGTALQNQLVFEASRLRKPLRLRVQVRSYDAVCKLVSAGMGVSLVPQQVAELLAPSLGISTVRLRDAWGTRHLTAAVRRLDTLDEAGRAFFELVTGVGTDRKADDET